VAEDRVMQEISRGIEMLHAGERDEARRTFDSIWLRIKDNAQPLHECTLAHFMADAQDDVTEELLWDLRALDAALHATEAEAKAYHDSLSIAGFLPSLHLNLGDDYLRLGDLEACRKHVDAAMACSDALPDTPYAATIRGGIARLADRLRSRQTD
jgi:hypothetical protein